METDPPEDVISIKRKRFYENCGFKENPYFHVAYHKNTPGHELVIMSYPSVLSKEEYSSFNSYLNDKVMKNAF